MLLERHPCATEALDDEHSCAKAAQFTEDHVQRFVKRIWRSCSSCDNDERVEKRWAWNERIHNQRSIHIEGLFVRESCEFAIRNSQMEMTSAIRMLVLLEVNDAVYVRSFVERVVPATRMRRNFMCIAWRKFEAEVLSTRKAHPRLRKQEEKRDELDDRGLHGGIDRAWKPT